MIIGKKKYSEHNLIINCNWEDEEETLLSCNVAVKDENDQIIPVGPFKFERLRDGNWRPLERPQNLTVAERKEIEYVIFKNYLPTRKK
ncbi:MAG TPA: hypothetical protein ENG66_00035 [Thermococcus sp.]|nr:hypothetical protein [Thermococcus sp.]